MGNLKPMFGLSVGGVLVALSLVLPARAAEERTAVVPPGQEELLAAMLGRGESPVGSCDFSGGGIEPTLIRGVYECPSGEIIVELRHPNAVADAVARSERFAVVVASGTAPGDFLTALEARIRAREGSFEWVEPSPSRPPAWWETLGDRARGLGPPLGAYVLAAILLWWTLRIVVRHWQAIRAAVQSATAPARRALAGSRRAAGARWEKLRHNPRFWLVLAITVVSFVARTWLAVVNDQSNDDHSTVANMIWEDGWRPPASSACMECSHAKLYHYALAAGVHFVRIWAPGLEASGVKIQLLVGNLLNVAAGMALLLVFLAFTRGGPWSPNVRILGFAFAAFNAGLVGIFVQTTNDGFCILFASLAIYSLHRFFRGDTLRWALAATVFVALAALSKASGWVIFASGSAVLGVSLLGAAPSLRLRYGMATALFTFGFLAVVTSFNPYRENLRERGTPFVNDAFDMPIMREEVPRPRFTWVIDNFFTFRFVELMRVPYNEWGPGPRSTHRESLWSQLYGRMFFLRFDQSIWANSSPALLVLGRVLLILGLVPFAALLIGTAALLRSTWRDVRQSGLGVLARAHDWHHLVHTGAMFAALIALIANYHRQAILFMWMKAFYLFPAVLSFYKLFLDGLEILWRRYPRLVLAWMVALVAASTVDTGWLILDLARTIHEF